MLNVMPISSLEDIKHVYYINLEHRVDRKQSVESELQSVSLQGTRFNAIKTKHGAIGCSMSHLKILQEAQYYQWDHVLIVEDDIQFLQPDVFKRQINSFFEQHHDWDVVLISGNNVPPYQAIDDTCVKVSRCQTTTGYLVNGHYIDTLIQNIREGITLLVQHPSDTRKYAIDIFWFKLQQQDRWFLIIPLTVVQHEGYSDIEQRFTNYRHLMQDLDKSYLNRSSRMQMQLK
jgi:glycosyl transferase family 25